MSEDRWQGPVRFQSTDKINAPVESDAGADAQDEMELSDTYQLAENLKALPVIKRRRSLAAKIALTSLALLIISVGGLEIFQFIESQLAGNIYFGWLVTGLLGFLLISSIVLIAKEFLSVRKLKRVERLRRQGDELIKSHENGSAREYCARLAKLNTGNAELTANYAQFESRLLDHYNDSETLTLFSHVYMRILDRRCYRLVELNAKQATLYAALSPFAVLDALLAVWRTMRMLREISAVYGGRPGTAASLLLGRKVIHTMLFVGASDLLADAAADALGRSVLSAISTQAAQGLAAGLFTARVGLKAMSLCRPMPFGREDRPSMKALSRSLFQTLKPGAESGLKPGSRQP